VRRSLTLLAALVALLAAPGAADAQELPPWQAAQRMQEQLFSAQTELLLEEADGGRAAARARALYTGELARSLGADAPAADRDLRAALKAAERALADGDQTALAAARGRLHTALMRGSYDVTLQAVLDRDAARARDWLLIREFREATRFTRPGVDATLALRELASGQSGPRKALLGVKKDLLDAYQASLSAELEQAVQAHERGFDSRLAETSAKAAGLWLILAPEYERARGAAARAEADAAFEEVARAGLREPDAFPAAADAATGVLEGFVAAPFTPEEQARRAAQLVRFLDLVPIEYRDGTDDGRVTIPFEIQEAIAFRDGAASAFADLEGELTERDPKATAEVEAALDELEGYVEDAGSGGQIVPEDDVEDAHEHASELLDDLFPEEWKEDDSQSDFDLIDLTLDRMESAVAAGEYRQAEQARLEAYAFFEFGPELSLRSIAPSVVAEVEALVWFGADGLDGLAKLIANRAPAREVRETRLALDEALEEGAGTLGEGASTATVVTNAAVIVFREGLEAVLILAAVMASLLGAARAQRKPMLIGAGLALIASGITFVLAQTVLTSLARYGEKLEAVVGLVAIGVLLLVLNWFFHRVYWTEHISRFHKRRKRLMNLTAGGLMSAQVFGFVLLGFSTVYREGFETVLFLQALELSSGLWVVLEGVALGSIGVALVAVATFVLERKLPYKKMLIVTGVLLTVVLVIMVGKTARTMQGVGWLPITPIDIDVPYWMGLWLGIFPTVETIVAQVAAFAFVIGSYVLAERMRGRGRRATAPLPAPAAASANGASGSNGSNGTAPDSQPAAEREPVGGAGKRGP
jgi:high-affinity iron transporter